jgi:AraC-like DNA-binding protein
VVKFPAKLQERVAFARGELANDGTLPFFFRRRYLMRLVVTAVAFVIVPLTIWLSIVFARSYNEIINAREDYYREITRRFGASFQREVSDFYSTAIQLSVDTRDSRNDSFVLTSAVFALNPYYYTECIRAVTQYVKKPNYKLGIYFPAEDCLFTDTNKYNADSFIANNLNITEPLSAAKAREFLRGTGTIRFFSTFYKMGNEGKLLLGIPVKLGMQKEPALVFYIFNDSFSDPLYAGEESIGFCVFSSSNRELLYSSGTYFPATPDQLPDGSRVFSIDDGAMGYIYMFIVPFDRITSNLHNFITTMKKTGALTFIGVIIIIAFMVYINYKPIEDFTNEMSERSRLTLNLLLGHLLYGLPIPWNEAEKLGLASPPGGGFCVVVVFDISFRTDNLNALRGVLLSRFGITSYSIDILGRSHTVIVCLLPSPETENLKECLEPAIESPGRFEIGPVANQLIGIKDSYEACLRQDAERRVLEGAQKDMPGSRVEKVHAPSPGGFRERMLKFVEDQFRNPQLSLTSVADHFSISIYSVSRFFNNEIGIGFSEFITAKRMDLARILLLSTEKEIIEIAPAVGLPNVNYFSRLFKTFYGMTPTRYRTKMRKQESSGPPQASPDAGSDNNPAPFNKEISLGG